MLYTLVDMFDSVPIKCYMDCIWKYGVYVQRIGIDPATQAIRRLHWAVEQSSFPLLLCISLAIQFSYTEQ